MTSWGRFLRLRRFLKGCLTSLATRLASTSSKNSGSTLSVPRIFLSTAFPSSKRPRSMRLLGVSTTKRAPTVRRSAGIPAKPRDSLHPQPPSILYCQMQMILKTFFSQRFFYENMINPRLNEVKSTKVDASRLKKWINIYTCHVFIWY